MAKNIKYFMQQRMDPRHFGPNTMGCLVRGITPSKMRWCIMSPFLKFGGMTSFLILILTNYEEWSGDGSTHSITQTK